MMTARRVWMQRGRGPGACRRRPNQLDDLYYGLRVLRRSPGTTCVTVLALALGIGVNMAVFTGYTGNGRALGSAEFATVFVVAENYFDVLGMKMVQGRAFGGIGTAELCL